MQELTLADTENYSTQKLDAAEQNGDFYVHLIDILRIGHNTRDAESLQAEIKQLLAEVPPHFRRLYLKALNDLKNEFNNGDAALTTVKNMYPKVPLEQAIVLAALSAEAQHYFDRPLDAEEIRIINQHVSQIRHRQITPSFHILELPIPVFDILKKYLGDTNILGRSLRFAVSVEPLQFLNVNMLPRHNDEAHDEYVDPDLIGNERHEVHHALLNFLEAQEFTRQNKEKGEAKELFRSFRHEVAGYLINCISSLDASFKPQWSIDNKFGDELNLIQDEALRSQVNTLITEVEKLVNQVIDDSFEGWYKSGFNLKSLLTACLTSSTFEEVVKNIQNMIDLINQKYRYSNQEREAMLRRARKQLPFKFQSSYDGDPMDKSESE